MTKKEKLPSLEVLVNRVGRTVIRRARSIETLRKKVNSPTWKVDIAVVDSRKMKSLNFSYLKHNYPTDVLSFPAPRVFRDKGLIGALVICQEILKRQAKEQKHSEKQELEVLLVHGLLHLLGYDHERGPRALQTMLRFEKLLLGPKAAKAGLISRLSRIG